MNRQKLLITAAMLAALSVVLEYMPLFYKFGEIKIDLVGVPWVIATLLLGLSGGLITSVVTSIVIALVSPTGWIGAFMKFCATVPMVIILGLIRARFGKRALPLFVGFIIALMVRAIGMLYLNYYFALPVFWNVPLEQALQYPAALIIVPNIALAIIEFSVAYLVVFKTKVSEMLDA